MTEELRDQHELLREQSDRCMELADRFDRGHTSAEALASAVFRLRRLLEDRNAFDAELLPCLHPGLDLDDQAIDALMRSRIAEHDTFVIDTSVPTTAALRATFVRLRDHMITEDRMLVRLGSAQSIRRRASQTQLVHARINRIG